MASLLLLVCMSSSLVLLGLFTSYALQLLADTRRRLPPGPRPLPVVANLLDLVGELPHRCFARLAERYGPLLTVRLGTVLVIVASSPGTAREFLQTHNARICLGDRTAPDAWHGGGHATNSIFFLPASYKWRALRRLATKHLFSRRCLDEMRPLRRDIVDDLLRRVSAAGGAPVDVGRAAFTAMADLQWHAMFSAGLDAATSHELRDVVREVVRLAFAPNISDFVAAVAAADLQGARRRMGRRITRLYELIDQQIQWRRRHLEAAAGGCNNDLLGVMLDMSEEDQNEDGVIINRDVIRAFLTDLFFAGSDTSSTIIEWAMAELLRSPHTMRKLQEELKMVMGSKPRVEEDDIHQLPYLEAVVKETLRLHPAVPLLPYKAGASTEMQGYTIPEGSTILVNVWAIHQNADTWTEPEKFIPERFLRTEINFFGRDFEFIPFSAGRRICLGMPLANRMLHVILGSLLHQFEWTLPEEVKQTGIDMTEKFGLAMSKATPLHAIAKKI